MSKADRKLAKESNWQNLNLMQYMKIDYRNRSDFVVTGFLCLNKSTPPKPNTYSAYIRYSSCCVLHLYLTTSNYFFHKRNKVSC